MSHLFSAIRNFLQDIFSYSWCLCSFLSAYILFSSSPFTHFTLIYINNVFCTSALLLAKRISIICTDALNSSCRLAAMVERGLIFKFYLVCGFFSSISTSNDCSVWFGLIYFSIVELFVFLKPAVENKSPSWGGNLLMLVHSYFSDCWNLFSEIPHGCLGLCMIVKSNHKVLSLSLHES